MKVLHITTSASPQSACTRINNSLLEAGVDSKILTLYYRESNELKTYKATSKYNINIAKINNKIEKAILRTFGKEAENIFSMSLFGLDISNNQLIQDADILHIHWINGGFLSLKSIEKLYMTKKKIIWTFHDSWSLTGGCHVRYDCTKYKEKCTKCPLIKTNSFFDLAKIIWERKEEFYKRIKIKAVVPSTHHYKISTNSKLGKYINLQVINNPIDTNIYKPYDKNMTRKNLGIDENKIVLAFGAVNANAKYKGFDYLLEALEKLFNNNNNILKDMELVIFGEGNNTVLKSMIERFEIKTKLLGYIYDQTELAMVYSACDIFVSPSIEESFGQTFAESMACGTIAIGFADTGAIDVIDHKVNGYLAKHLDIDDLLEGLLWGINNFNDKEIRKKARNKVIDKFNYLKIANQYIKTYKQL